MSRRERPHLNRDYSLFIDEWHQQLISRRKFILSTVAVVSVALFTTDSYSATTRHAAENERVENETGQLDKHALQTLSAVQNHLFPKASDSPGAGDINALTYLQNNVLNDSARDQEEKRFILREFESAASIIIIKNACLYWHWNKTKKYPRPELRQA